MALQVLIKKGTYGHGKNIREFENEKFDLVKPFTTTASGQSYVTVIGTKARGLEDRNCRIKVESDDLVKYLNSNGNEISLPKPEEQQKAMEEPENTAEMEYREQESDEQAMARISDMFEVLNELTVATSKSIIRGMVISGPPGVGKSYGVEETLKEALMFKAKLQDDEPPFQFINGTSSSLCLYKTLYYNRKKGFVTVFDDCDSVLYDEKSLNILKAALDSKDKRKISWLSETHLLSKEEIPDTFTFEGSVIFLTNTNFEDSASNKLKDHLAAIMSRCHYINVDMHSVRDQLLRIKQVVQAGMLDKYKHLSKTDKQEVVEFIFDYAEDLREISLRMVLKVADLAQSYRTGALKRHWKELAITTCLNKQAKYKQLLNNKS